MEKLFKTLIATAMLFTLFIPVNTYASGIQPLDYIEDPDLGATAYFSQGVREYSSYSTQVKYFTVTRLITYNTNVFHMEGSMTNAKLTNNRSADAIDTNNTGSKSLNYYTVTTGMQSVKYTYQPRSAALNGYQVTRVYVRDN